MKSTKVRLKTRNYFPPQFHILSYILIFFGIGLLVVEWYIGLILMILSFLVLTTHYGVEVDINKKLISEYLNILGFSKSDKTPFSAIEYIYINANTYSQEYGFVPRYYESGTMYTAYLKTADGIKIFLSDHKILRKLNRRIMPFANQLNIEVKNLT